MVGLCQSASGGFFEFNVMAANSGMTTQEATVWTEVLLPNSTIVGPLLGPATFDLAAASSVERDRTQSVPANAPTGMYSYNAYIGMYPDIVWAEDSFDFEKLGLVGNDAHNLDNWVCSGEVFEKAYEPASAKPVLSLLQSEIFPNPFNQTTTVRYTLHQAADVQIEVYDTSGRLITSLLEGRQESGDHCIEFDGSKLASGIYLLRTNSAEHAQIHKIVLVK